ncbi:MAG: hypothetical protein ABR992_02095 [Solirubrobacteraceae bacterium]
MALVAVVALLLVPAGASAASPVLELVAPSHSLPVHFAAEGETVTAEMAGFKILVHCTASHGEGEITGPRSTESNYWFTGCEAAGEKCNSERAPEGEIKTGSIVGDLVYIDQAKGEVGILLNPSGGTYISFECGAESAQGQGSFLAPVSPIDQESTSFTATLSQVDSVQTPNEYENAKGERVQAIPTGRRSSNPFVPTGVELAMTVHPTVPVEIKAVSAEEIEAEQHEKEVAALQATLKGEEGALTSYEEHAKQAAQEAKKHEEEALTSYEEHAKQAGQEAKKHEEEANAQIAAAVKKQQEAEVATKKAQEEVTKLKASLTRAQSLARALRQCEKQPKSQRARCMAGADKRYGAKVANRGRRRRRVAG